MKSLRAAPLIALAVLSSSCRQDMHDQPKLEPYEASTFFADGRASRPVVAGTVARGALEEDEHLFQGRVAGKLADTFPFEITREEMLAGRRGYEVFCAPCHDGTGGGNGMIVERGMLRPPSFHVERLRAAPPGHFFDVITNGFGVMYDYSDRIAPRERWAIVAYVRALQRSQNATLDDVPADRRASLVEQR